VSKKVERKVENRKCHTQVTLVWWENDKLHVQLKRTHLLNNIQTNYNTHVWLMHFADVPTFLQPGQPCTVHSESWFVIVSPRKGATHC
jgi:hypothetical protein